MTKTKAEIDAFVADLKKTRGGVTVTEVDGETVVRTRAGEEHRFTVAKPKKAD